MSVATSLCTRYIIMYMCQSQHYYIHVSIAATLGTLGQLQYHCVSRNIIMYSLHHHVNVSVTTSLCTHVSRNIIIMYTCQSQHHYVHMSVASSYAHLSPTSLCTYVSRNIIMYMCQLQHHYVPVSVATLLCTCVSRNITVYQCQSHAQDVCKIGHKR